MSSAEIDTHHHALTSLPSPRPVRVGPNGVYR